MRFWVLLYECIVRACFFSFRSGPSTPPLSRVIFLNPFPLLCRCPLTPRFPSSLAPKLLPSPTRYPRSPFGINPSDLRSISFPMGDQITDGVRSVFIPFNFLLPLSPPLSPLLVPGVPKSRLGVGFDFRWVITLTLSIIFTRTSDRLLFFPSCHFFSKVTKQSYHRYGSICGDPVLGAATVFPLPPTEITRSTPPPFIPTGSFFFGNFNWLYRYHYPSRSFPRPPLPRGKRISFKFERRTPSRAPSDHNCRLIKPALLNSSIPPQVLKTVNDQYPHLCTAIYTTGHLLLRGRPLGGSPSLAAGHELVSAMWSAL